MAGVVVAIKPHPAETADAYGRYRGAANRLRVLPPDAPLAPLLAAADVVVTVNSTVALDAARLDVPALVIGLPNNLSPFVDAGALAGSTDGAVSEAQLERILYDEGFREQLAARRRAVFGEPVKAEERRAAQRSAEAVLELVGPR
jgi:CDP-glycerol glycerophosphotransferase (TagB/SpsB family)